MKEEDKEHRKEKKIEPLMREKIDAAVLQVSNPTLSGRH